MSPQANVLRGSRPYAQGCIAQGIQNLQDGVAGAERLNMQKSRQKLGKLQQTAVTTSIKPYV